MEPLLVAVHSVYNIGQIRANQNVAIFGAGPVGLLCMAVAKACGASRIIAIDIVKPRLDFAHSYAATDIFTPPTMNEGESKMAYSKRAVSEMTQSLGIEERGSKGIDLVIDASGAEVCVQMGIFLAKHGGRTVIPFRACSNYDYLGTYVQVGMGTA